MGSLSHDQNGSVEEGTFPLAAKQVSATIGDNSIMTDDGSFWFESQRVFQDEGLIASDNLSRLLAPSHLTRDGHSALRAPGGVLYSEAAHDLRARTDNYLQVAEVIAKDDAPVIGRVEAATGANVMRNGVSIPLQTGDLVHKGDAVQTEVSGSLVVKLFDGSDFNLHGSASTILNNAPSTTAIIPFLPEQTAPKILDQGTLTQVAPSHLPSDPPKTSVPTFAPGSSTSPAIVGLSPGLPVSRSPSTIILPGEAPPLTSPSVSVPLAIPGDTLGSPQEPRPSSNPASTVRDTNAPSFDNHILSQNGRSVTNQVDPVTPRDGVSIGRPNDPFVLQNIDRNFALNNTPSRSSNQSVAADNNVSGRDQVLTTETRVARSDDASGGSKITNATGAVAASTLKAVDIKDQPTPKDAAATKLGDVVASKVAQAADAVSGKDTKAVDLKDQPTSKDAAATKLADVVDSRVAHAADATIGKDMKVVDLKDHPTSKDGTATKLGDIVDTTAPISLAVALKNDTGNGLTGTGTDGITKDATLTVTGQETNALLQYSANGIDGWSTTAIAAKEGANDYFIRQVDSAGNLGTGTEVKFTLDTTAPTALGVILAHDTGGSSTDRLTNDASLTLSLKEQGANIEYSLDGKTWSTTPVTKEGVNDVFVHQVDKAGNAGVSTELKFILDTTAPKPMLTNVIDKVLIGTSEANSTVSIYDSGKLLGTVKAGADGSWSFAANAPDNTTHAYTEAATDLAGNTGSSAGVGLYTPAANQALVGGSGDDVLIGQPKDTLTGAAGHDTFVFNTGFGKETVTDFVAGTDTIQFDHTLFADFAAVQSHAQQVGSDTLIKDDGGNILTLHDVKLASLHASDFHFA